MTRESWAQEKRTRKEEMLRFEFPQATTGCPNMGARWDAESGEWIKQRKCFECGCTVNAGCHVISLAEIENLAPALDAVTVTASESEASNV